MISSGHDRILIQIDNPPFEPTEASHLARTLLSLRAHTFHVSHQSSYPQAMRLAFWMGLEDGFSQTNYFCRLLQPASALSARFFPGHSGEIVVDISPDFRPFYKQIPYKVFPRTPSPNPSPSRITESTGRTSASSA